MPDDPQKVAKATAFIVLSSCGFGSLSTLTVLTARAGLPLVPAMFWRYFVASLILFFVLRKRTWQTITRNNAIRLLLVGGLGQAVVTYLSLRALDYLPVGPLGFLFYTYPAWVALTSAVFGREDLTLARFIALSIAMCGIVVMVGTPASSSLNPVGVMLALGTALLYALYLPALQHVQRGVPPAVSSLYLVVGVCIAFLIAGVTGRQLQMPESMQMWGYILLLSVVSTVIAFAALIAGLRVLGPVRTSIIATIEPFFTAVLGILLLAQPMSRNTMSGGALIAVAVLLLQFTGRNNGVIEKASG